VALAFSFSSGFRSFTPVSFGFGARVGVGDILKPGTIKLCSCGWRGKDGSGGGGAFAMLGRIWVASASGNGGGGLEGSDECGDIKLSVDADAKVVEDLGIDASLRFVLSICRNFASIIAILSRVASVLFPEPVFNKLNVVGRDASIILFRLTPVLPLSGGAWCANVTTSLRPRKSLSCAVFNALSASWGHHVSKKNSLIFSDTISAPGRNCSIHIL